MKKDINHKKMIEFIGFLYIKGSKDISELADEDLCKYDNPQIFFPKDLSQKSIIKLLKDSFTKKDEIALEVLEFTDSYVLYSVSLEATNNIIYERYEIR